ncbi:MAG: YdeI/OmpD-associated family protein [Armatimonadota bacterium]
MKYDFNAQIKLLEGKIKWSVIYFPHPAQEHFGTNGRVNVKAVVDGHEFDTTLLPSRNGHYLIYNSGMKKAVGKKLGDNVRVMLERCEQKREVTIPDYISVALKEHSAFDSFLKMPDYMKREEISKIESAQHDETKSKRLHTLIAKLTDKRPAP